MHAPKSSYLSYENTIKSISYRRAKLPIKAHSSQRFANYMDFKATISARLYERENKIIVEKFKKITN